MAHVGGERVLELADGIGHGHGDGAGLQAEVGVLGADAELDGGHGQHGVHVEVHAVDRRDGAALQPVDSLRALAVLQRALVSDGTRFVLFFSLLRARVRVLEGEKKANEDRCVTRLQVAAVF